MKILQVPFHFYPDAVGGTEIYTLALAHRLQQAGQTVEVAAPGEMQASYHHEGIPVHRFTVGRDQDVASLYGDGDAAAAEQFGEIVDRVQPDVVHLHALSPAISLRTLRKARQRGIPVILTVHIPGVFCSRGTLLLYGEEICDGRLEPGRCSRCVLHSRGLPKPLAQIAGSAPASLGKALATTRLQASWITALRMTHLMHLRGETLGKILNELSHVVAVCEWVREGLLRNGAAPQKLTVCRQGMTQQARSARPMDSTPPGTGRRIAYAGRIAHAKGVHTLIEAVVRSPRLPIRLDVYGIVQDEQNYMDQLRALAGKDARIRFLPPVANDLVIDTLRPYDAVAVPSIWMESGPLTVYDAFAAGVPVIGSRRGGIAELVTHEQDGLLVEATDVAAWAAAMMRISTEDGLVERLRRGVRPPRTMDTVAGEMLELYEKLARQLVAVEGGKSH